AQPDYQTIQAIAAVARLADAELRDELIARPLPDPAPTGALLLRADLLQAADRAGEAADLLSAAARRQPENVSLLNKAQALLRSLDRLADATALYETYVEQ